MDLVLFLFSFFFFSALLVFCLDFVQFNLDGKKKKKKNCPPIKRVQPACLEKRANQRDSLAISQNDKAGGNSEYVEVDETG